MQFIVAVAAVQRVIPCAAEHEVIPSQPGQGVVARPAVQVIAAASADNGVSAVVADNQIPDRLCGGRRQHHGGVAFIVGDGDDHPQGTVNHALGWGVGRRSGTRNVDEAEQGAHLPLEAEVPPRQAIGIGNARDHSRQRHGAGWRLVTDGRRSGSGLIAWPDRAGKGRDQRLSIAHAVGKAGGDPQLRACEVVRHPELHAGGLVAPLAAD
ncbi:hypothetical protein D3C75_617360 [compost metagenome]